MHNIILKEMKLSASIIAYLFILFGLMFFLPGYPVLCGAFFTALGIFKSFEYAREANDIVFSVLLPIAKKDVVRGRYYFVCLIELGSLLVMAAAMIVRMTVLSDAPIYLNNAMMNANPFALGCAFVVFGLFNWIFAGAFFKTGYKVGRPFVIYMIAAFAAITVFEALHHIKGLEFLNAFGTDCIGMQLILLLAGVVLWIMMTLVSCRRACMDFEKIDI